MPLQAPPPILSLDSKKLSFILNIRLELVNCGLSAIKIIQTWQFLMNLNSIICVNLRKIQQNKKSLVLILNVIKKKA